MSRSRRQAALLVTLSLTVSLIGPNIPEGFAAPNHALIAQSGESSAAGPADLATVVSLGKELSALCQAGDMQAALPIARKAVSLAEKLEPANADELCLALNNLAIVMQSLGNSADARPYLERALKITEQNYGANSINMVEQLNKLALLLGAQQQDYESAEQLYERSLKIAQKEAPDSNTLAQTLSGYASVLSDNNKAPKALLMYKDAKAIIEKQNGAESAEFAAILDDEAVALQNLNRLDESLKLLERSVAIREKLLGQDDPEVIRNQSNMAMVMCAQAASLQADAGQTQDKNARESLLSRARANYKKAKPLLEKIVYTYEKTPIPNRIEMADALNNLGNAESVDEDEASAASFNSDNKVKARKHFLKAAEYIDGQISNVLPHLSFAEQRAFLTARIPGEISLLLSSCTQGEDLTKAYNYYFRWKGLLVHCLQRQSALISNCKSPDGRKMIEQLQRVRSALAQWYLIGGIENKTVWKQKNDLLTSEKESLERELSSVLGTGDWRDVLENVDVTGFCQNLKPDETLIDIYLYNNSGAGTDAGWRYAAIVTNAQTKKPALVDLGARVTLDSAVEVWRGDVLGGRAAEAASWNDLSEKVWSPVIAKLPTDSKNVWICPDGELLLVPWHLFSRINDKTNHLTAYQADSARELASLRQKHAKNAASTPAPHVVLAGGVDFNAQAVVAGSAGSSSAPGAAQEPMLNMPMLPGTFAEITELDIMSRLKKFDVEMFSGASATKAAVVAALPGADYVHLATHGYFMGDSWLQNSRPSSRTAAANAKPGQSAGTASPTGGAPGTATSPTGGAPGTATSPTGGAPGTATSPTGGAPGTDPGTAASTTGDGAASQTRADPGAAPGQGTGADGSTPTATSPDKEPGSPLELLEPPSAQQKAPGDGLSRALHVLDRVDSGRSMHRNPLVESGLAFAGANRIDPSGKLPSNLLTAEELVGLDLSKCKLITLSACDTGKGKEVVGQGLLGMRAAIMAAGADSVVMSLWKVPDRPTVELMKNFYSNVWLKGMPKSEALKAAQESVRTANGGRFAQPVNWAAWILVGD